MDRLVRVRNSMKDLLGSEAHEWERNCEAVFSEFRVSCIHLRKENQALDSIQEKQVAWRFICKFSKAFPFHHKRCEEVLNILLLSDAWMREFISDPEVNVDDLPPGIADKFRQRLEEVRDPNDPGAAPPAVQHTMLPKSQSITLVVQRCTSASLSSDAGPASTMSINAGLVVAVSFASDARPQDAQAAARFLLTAKLSGPRGWMPGRASAGEAQSVLELCQRGEEQGILVYPQTSLISEFKSKDALDLQYGRSRQERSLRQLYDGFVEALHACGRELSEAGTSPWQSCPQIVSGDVGEDQYLEVQSAGPFMHSFSF